MDDVDTGFVGRVGELEQVRHAIASDRSCMLIGPPGIGKSALMAAVVSGLSRVQWTPVVQGLEILSDVPLAPWLAFLGGDGVASDDATEVAHAVASTAGSRVLLIDDVHWFDPLSTEVLDLVCASRVALVSGRAQFDGYEKGLPRLTASAAVFELAPLSDAESVQLASRLRPGASAVDVTRIARGGDGNPLLTEFSARIGPNSGDPNPIAAVVERVDAQHQSALAMLAAAETELAVDHLSKPQPLVDVGLAVSLNRTRMRISHPVVADVVREVLGEAAMENAHRRLAALTSDPFRRARHLLRSGDRDAARKLAVTAGRNSTTRFERAALYDLAASADESADPGLLVDAAEALVDAGRGGRAVELARSGRCADPDLERRRLTALARGAWTNDVPDKDSAVAALALTDPDRHPAKAIQLHSILARITGRFEWDADAALAHATAGLRTSERHHCAVAEAHSSMATALLVALRDGWREHLDRAIDAARSEDDVRTELVATDTLFIGELVFGELDRCLPLAESALQQAIERNIPFATDRFRMNSLFARMVLDDTPGDVAAEACRLLEQPLAFRSRDHLSIIAMLTLADCGRDLSAREVLAAAPGPLIDDPTSHALRAVAVAEIHLAAGRARDALAAATQCLEYPVIGFPARQMAAPIRSWASRDLGLAPPPEIGPGFPNAETFRLEAKGVDALDSDPALAASLFASALGVWGDHRSRYTLRCRLGLAAARLAGGDRELGLADAATLVQVCDERGFVPLARRARELIRHHGGRSSRRLDSRSGLVTGAQEELLQLVLEGLSTKEIANRLRIAPSTVDSSIASAQRVLGCSSRLAAAVRVQTATSSPSEHRMRYSTDRSAVRAVAAMLAGSTVVRELEDAPAVPWKLPPAVVWTTDVVDADSAVAALRGLLRGASMLVWLRPSDSWSNGFLTDAQRLVEVEVLRPVDRPDLSPEQSLLWELVASGRTTPEIADELNVSRRTLERKLARLRECVGVSSNAELAARFESV